MRDTIPKRKNKSLKKANSFAIFALLFVMSFSLFFSLSVSGGISTIFDAIGKIENGSDVASAAITQTDDISSSGTTTKIENDYDDYGDRRSILSASDWQVFNIIGGSFDINWSWDNTKGVNSGWGDQTGGNTGEYAVMCLTVPLGEPVKSALRNGVRVSVKLDAGLESNGSQDAGTIGLFRNVNDAKSGSIKQWGWNSKPSNYYALAHDNTGDWSWGWVDLSCTGVLDNNAENIVLSFHNMASGGWGIRWESIFLTFTYASTTISTATASSDGGNRGSISPGAESHTFNATNESFNVTATPNSGDFFRGWSEGANYNGAPVDNTYPTRTFSGTNVKPNTTYTANFDRIKYRFNTVDYYADEYADNVMSILTVKTNIDYFTITNNDLPVGYSKVLTFYQDSSGSGTVVSKPTAEGEYSAKLEIKNPNNAVVGSRVIKFVVVDGDFGRLASGVSGVWGSKTNPYVLSNPKHLRNLSGIGNGTQIAADSIVGLGDITSNEATATDRTYANSYFLVLNDIDLANGAFIPIGNLFEFPFKGNIDGNNKAIIGLNVVGAKTIGLFGFFSGTVNKYNFDNPASGDTASGKTLTVRGSVTRSGDISDPGYVGGIFGEIANKSVPVYISGCLSYVTVNGGGKNYIGGIAGIAHTGDFVNCENFGNVSGADDVGGIVGRRNAGNVIGCKNSGTISGNANVGGIVGNVNASGANVQNCYNQGKVSGISNVGGIAGRSVGGIAQCVNNGAVSASGSNAGGIVGNGTCRICFNFGEVGGGSNVGGAIGAGAAPTNCWSFYTGAKTAGHNTFGSFAVVNGSAIGIDNIKPTADGETSLAWTDTLSRNFTGWIVTDFAVASGKYIHIATGEYNQADAGGSNYAAPSSMATTESGNGVNIDRMYFASDNAYHTVYLDVRDIKIEGKQWVFNGTDEATSAVLKYFYSSGASTDFNAFTDKTHCPYGTSNTLTFNGGASLLNVNTYTIKSTISLTLNGVEYALGVGEGDGANITNIKITPYDTSAIEIKYGGLASGYDGAKKSYIDVKDMASGFTWYKGGVDFAPDSSDTMFMLYSYGFGKSDYINKVFNGTASTAFLGFYADTFADTDFLKMLVGKYGGSATLDIDMFTDNTTRLTYAAFTLTFVSTTANITGGTITLRAFVLSGDFGAVSVGSGIWGGETSPYVINNWAQMFRLSAITNGVSAPWNSVAGVNGIDSSLVAATNTKYENSYFDITKDLTLKSANKTSGNWSIAGLSTVYNFLPIGSDANPFGGNFSGGEDADTSAALTLFLNFTGANARDYVGLFGFLSGANVSNLLLFGAVEGANGVGGLVGHAENSNINGIKNSASVTGADDVGGIVGYASGSILSNLSNTAAVNGANRVGGIVGDMSGGALDGANGGVSSNGNVTAHGGDYVGGIAGRILGANIKLVNTHISGKISGGSYVGAYFGSATGSEVGYSNADGAEKVFTEMPTTTDGNVVFLGVDNTGSVTVSASGGYVGLLAGNISKLLMFADIANVTGNHALSAGGNYVGGVIGCIDMGGALVAGQKNDGAPYEFINNKTVTSTGDNVGGIIGGIMNGAGVSYGAGLGIFTLGYAVGIHPMTDGAYKNTASISGKNNVGGIVGGMVKAGSDSIYTRFHTGASNIANISGTDNVGGLVGSVEANFVLLFENTNKIYTSFNGESGDGAPHTVSGANNVGGIVGNLRADSAHRLTKLYNTAIINATGNNIGGIVGNMSIPDSESGDSREGGKIESCFVTAQANTQITRDTNLVRGADFVGGIVGYFGKGTMLNCYTQGFMFDEGNNIGGNVTTRKGGVLGYRHPTNTTVDGSWAIYLSKISSEAYNADYRAEETFKVTSANKLAKFVILDSALANINSFAEMSVTVGMKDASALTPSECRASANRNTEPNAPKIAENKLTFNISISALVNKEGTSVRDGYSEQLAFYTASGRDATTANKLALSNSVANPSQKPLFVGFANNMSSFSVVRTEVVFQNIPKRNGATPDNWGKVWDAHYKRPSNDVNYSPTFDAGYPKDQPPAEYPYYAKGEIYYQPSITVAGTEQANVPKVKIGAFDRYYSAGTPATPKIIQSQSDWDEFASGVRGGSGISGVDYSNGYYFKLADEINDTTNRIDVNMDNLAGDVLRGLEDDIATLNNNYFCGIFDGNGKTIHINIDQRNASDGRVNRLSLFPNASEATFKNLTVKGQISTKNDPYLDAGFDVAGFVGKPFGNLDFFNCISDVNISCQRLGAGIIGYTRTFKINMTDCVNKGDIATTQGPTWVDTRWMNEYPYGTGGIIAYVSNETTIESCYNSGNITGYCNVGGIVGRSDSRITIKNSANSGIIWANGINPAEAAEEYAKKRGLNVYSSAGGIAGNVAKSGALYAYACYNSGEVRARGNFAGGIAGILGTIPGNSHIYEIRADYKSEIKYCYNSGTISAGYTPEHTPQGGGEQSVGKIRCNGTGAGGLVGLLVSVDIDYCYNTGQIVSYGCETYGGFMYYAYLVRIGGLVGEGRARNNGFPINIKHSYNIGEIVNGEGGGSAEGGAGIIGYIENYESNNNTHVDNSTVFSLHNQVYYPTAGTKYRDEIGLGDYIDTDPRFLRSGTIINSLADYTAVYDNVNDRMSVDARIEAGLGASSVQSIIDADGNYTTVEDLKDGSLPGFIYTYGCIPQLAILGLDTKSSLSMLSVGYGMDNYGNFNLYQSGDEYMPYIVKDGLDMLILSSFVNAKGGNVLWHGTDKYIEFANGVNNTDADITEYIDLSNYKYRNGRTGGDQLGKNQFSYLYGAVNRNDPSESSNQAYGKWSAKNKYYDANSKSFVGGGTFGNVNFYPIGMYGAGNYFGGSLSGGYEVGADTRNTEIRNAKIDYTKSNSDSMIFAGLFGRVQDATLQNMTLSGSVVGRYSGTSSGSAGVYVGGFAGSSGGHTVMNNLQAGSLTYPLSVSAKTNETNRNSAGSVGGIAGRISTSIYADGNYDYGEAGTISTISACKSYANISGYKSYVGGIFGMARGAENTTVTLKNCATLGGAIGVDANSGSASENKKIGSYIGGVGGGLSGDDQLTLVFESCSVGIKLASAGNFKVRVVGENIVGGIIGNALGSANGGVTFSNCSVYADVKIEKAAASSPKTTLSQNDVKYGSALGGIVGYIDGMCPLFGTTVFAGTISVDNTPSTQVVKNVGGIVGFMGKGASLTGAINVSGTISIDTAKRFSNAAYDPSVAQQSMNVGGIAGSASTAMFNGTYEIAPTINAPTSTNVGGFLGLNEGQCIILADNVVINIGKETNGANGDITGLDYVGGFIGQNLDALVIGETSFNGIPYSGEVAIFNHAYIDGRSRVGGIVGGNSGEAANITIGKGQYTVTIINNGGVGAKIESKGSTDDENNALLSKYFGGFIGLNENTATINFMLHSSLQNDGQVGINVLGDTNHKNAYQFYVGGLVGANSGVFSVTSEMKNTANGDVFGFRYVGGSIGSLQSGKIAGTFANDGSVTGADTVGGVVGEIQKNATIGKSHFKNSGEVKAVGGILVGGIVGGFYGTIRGDNTNADGAAYFSNEGRVSAGSNAGGIIGVLTGVVENAIFINSGDLSFSGGDALGGSIGMIADTFLGRETQEVSVTSTRFEYVGVDGANTNLSVSGTTYENGVGGVGGVIGIIKSSGVLLQTPATWNNNTFYVSGNVSAPNCDNVGGVIGKVDNSFITIKNMLAYGNRISGRDNVGGIVGYNGTTNTLQGEDASLAFCFNVRGTLSGRGNVGGIVGGAAPRAYTHSCYWVVEFKNFQLQQADSGDLDDLNTANMDMFVVSSIPLRILNEGEEGYIPDLIYSDYETYLQAYKRAALDIYNAESGNTNKCMNIDDLRENNGRWVFYKQAEGQTIYSTGKLNTGYFFAYASDADTAGGSETIKTAHSGTDGALTYNDLDFWKFIASAYSSDELEKMGGVNPIASVASNIVQGAGGGLVQQNHMYATASAGVPKNGQYLFMRDSKTAASLKDAGGKFYLDISTATSGNVLLLYKEVMIKRSITYNGYNRYAPITGLVGFIGEPAKSPKAGAYYYVLDAEADAGANFGTEAGTYKVKGTIYRSADLDGVLTQQVVGSIESENGSFTWKIEKRKIEATSEASDFGGGVYTGEYSHHITFTLPNIVGRDYADGKYGVDSIRFPMTGGGGSGATAVDFKTYLTKQVAALPDYLEFDDAEAGKIFWSYGEAGLGTDADWEYSIDEENGKITEGSIYTYTFRVFLKNVDTYKASITRHEADGRSNYTPDVEISQEITLKRAEISVVKQDFIHSDTHSSESKHVYDGFKHGASFTFGGFKREENSDTFDALSGKKLIEMMLANASVRGEGVERVRDSVNVYSWLSETISTYGVDMAAGDIGQNYRFTPEKSADWIISQYEATVDWGGFQKDFQYTGEAQSATATILGPSDVWLTQKVWEDFVSFISAKMSPTDIDIASDERIIIQSTYAAGARFKATVTFKFINVASTAGKYTATLGSSNQSVMIIKDVSNTMTVTPHSLTMTDSWANNDERNEGSYVYNTSHQGLSGVSFAGFIGRDTKASISSMIKVVASGVSYGNNGMGFSFKEAIDVLLDEAKYTVTITADGKYGRNYAFSGENFLWTISKLDIALRPVNADLVFTYDGKLHTMPYEAAGVGVVGGVYNNDTLSAAIDYRSGGSGVCNYKEGGWDITASNVSLVAKRERGGVNIGADTKANYNVTKSGGSIAIERAEISVTWAGNKDFIYVYDGASHAPTASANSDNGLVGDETIKFSVLGAEKNVKGTSYIASVDGFNDAIIGGANEAGDALLTNYVFASNQPTAQGYTIAPKTISVTFDRLVTLTYNGAWQGVTWAVDGAVSGETVVVTVDNYRRVNANVGTDAYTATVNGIASVSGTNNRAENYTLNGVFNSVEYTIGKKQIGVDWSGMTFVYDAKNFKPQATATNAVNGENVTLAVNGVGINVGSYTSTAALEGISGVSNPEGEPTLTNYYLTENNESPIWTITPRAVTVTLNLKGTKAFMSYGGSAIYAKLGNRVGSDNSSSTPYRQGQGLSASNFSENESEWNSIVITAEFKESDVLRSRFDAYVNNVVYNESTKKYSIGKGFYKMLVFGVSGVNSDNYKVAVDKFMPDATTENTFSIYDSADTARNKEQQGGALSIAIEKYKINANYENTVQSYVDDDNQFKTSANQWTDVSGYYNDIVGVEIDVTNGWKNSVYKKYTAIDGEEGSANFGASIKPTGDGAYLNYILVGQPTLIIGYFVDLGNFTYQVTSLADLMLSTYYYQLSFDNKMTAIKYKWVQLCQADDYNSNKNIPKDINGIKFEGATWDEYFAAYEAWYNGQAQSVKLADIEITSDDNGNFGFYKPYLYTPQAYINFTQTANISGVMTQKDFDILNEQFGGNWGKGTGNLKNFVHTKVGGVLSVYGGIFAGGYAGEYNGGGYVIDCFNIVSVASAGSENAINVGMFQMLEGEKTIGYTDASGAENEFVTRGSVKYLHLRNFALDFMDFSGANNTLNIGGIVGYSEAENPIISSSFHGNIRVNAPTSTVAVGGIIGGDAHSLASARPESVENVIAIGSINVVAAAAFVGGIVGSLGADGAALGAVSMMEIYARANTNIIGGLIGIYNGTDANVLNSAGAYGYLTNSVVNANTQAAINKAIGNGGADSFGVTYSAMRAGSVSGYNKDRGNIYDGSISVYGKYDVIPEGVVSGEGVNPRESMRLGDIVDEYLLLYSVDKVETTSNEIAVSVYQKAESSWLVGNAIGTDTSKITMDNLQHVGLLNMFRFASFNLARDIVFYTSHVGTTAEGAFFGHVTSNGHTINVRGGTTIMFQYIAAGSIPNGMIIAK